MAEWLLLLGAEVTGFSLPAPTTPALFEQLGLATRLQHIVGDVRDLAAVRAALAASKPDFVFHLAAQPLVRLSYDQPAETYATNVMGTVNVLEAVRLAGRRCIVVSITTDKCYENKEWVHSYREEDPMGGYDPYSSSKGAAELVIAAYRKSYFSAPDSKVKLASARAGNVIGGGDWALDRIVPDCIRALRKGETIPVRNKIATRPWQHVLEPLSGYLLLASELAKPVQISSSSPSLVHDSGSSPGSRATGDLNWQRERLNALCGAFNFGPALGSNRTVAELVQEILKHWPGEWLDKSDPHAVHEAKLLNLATDKAHHFLGWSPAWNFAETIARTVGWYREVAEMPLTDADRAGGVPGVHALTAGQIAAYTASARAAGISWAF